MLLQALFDEIDTDCHGSIEDSELLVHLLKKGVDGPAIEQLFKALDINSDGHISRDEWRQGFSLYTSLAGDPRLVAPMTEPPNNIHPPVLMCRGSDWSFHVHNFEGKWELSAERPLVNSRPHYVHETKCASLL